MEIPNTVNTLIATTSRKRPPRVSDYFADNRFASQSTKMYMQTLSQATTS